MIWWSGRGILVPIIFFFVFIAGELITELITDQRAMDTPWIVAIQFLVSAALIYAVSPKARSEMEATGKIPQPGQGSFGPSEHDSDHSFLSIPCGRGHL